MVKSKPIQGFVVIKHPGSKARILDVDTKEIGYKMLQKHVDGFIECIRANTLADGKSIDIWINEEGKLNGMKPNLLFPHDVVCGPILICLGTKDGRSVPFPDFVAAMNVMVQTMQFHIEDPDSVEVPEPKIEIKFGDEAKKEIEDL